VLGELEGGQAAVLLKSLDQLEVESIHARTLHEHG
jgi:hypothetical protein